MITSKPNERYMTLSKPKERSPEWEGDSNQGCLQKRGQIFFLPKFLKKWNMTTSKPNERYMTLSKPKREVSRMGGGLKSGVSAKERSDFFLQNRRRLRHLRFFSTWDVHFSEFHVSETEK